MNKLVERLGAHRTQTGAWASPRIDTISYHVERSCTWDDKENKQLIRNNEMIDIQREGRVRRPSTHSRRGVHDTAKCSPYGLLC